MATNLICNCILFALFTSCTQALASNSECRELPAVFNETCCNSPEITPETTTELCYKEVSAKNVSDHLEGCMINDCILKQEKVLTNDEIDLSKLIDFMSKQNYDKKNKVWEETLKKSVTDCVNYANANKETILKIMSENPFNIDHKMCNPLSYYATTCTYFNIISSCPSSEWTKSVDCDALQVFVKKCGTDVETLKYWFQMEY